MVDRIELVQNDTGPQILFTLADATTGAPVDLSRLGTEMVLNFAMNGTTGQAVVLPLIHGPSAELGQCMLDWPEGVLAVPGSYVGEIQVTSPEGSIQTTLTKIKFRIRQEIG